MGIQPRLSSLMRHLMDNIQDNIYFMDHEGRIILINKAGAKWLGYDSPEELIGKTDIDIFTEEHGRAAFEDEQRIIETGVPILGKEERETWADGHETWVSTSKMPMCDDSGKIIGIFGISRDITDRKLAEIRTEKYAAENRRFREEMENELQMAAELQKTFFPISYPVFPDGAEEADRYVEFCHHHHACELVGGDFCSIRKLSQTKVGIFICDVMGHGVIAALGTAIARAIVEEISHREEDPGGFLTHMNRALIPILRQGGQFMFATACYMVLDVSNGVLRHAVAGHPEPIKFNKGGADWLGDGDFPPGPALAIAEASEYATCECRLEPGDAVLFYTDGIYEVRDGAGNELGQEKLIQMVQRSVDVPLSELYTKLVEGACAFSASGKLEDDSCIVGFRLHRIPGG